MNVTPHQQSLAVGYARRLVQDQTSVESSPHERLWEIARKLNVSRIEPGATRSEGFVKRLGDGTFAVYYSANLSKPRRRYTVAHELAHLVLEQYVPHVTHEDTVARRGAQHTGLERVVDRIAAELIMPEEIVAGLLKSACRKSMLDDGKINKLRTITEMKTRLGVSLTAMVFRLVELGELLSLVSWQDFDPKTGKTLRQRIRLSEHVTRNALQLADGLDTVRPVQSNGAFKAESIDFVKVETQWGRRILRCSSWIRRNDGVEQSQLQYWTIGWTWNTGLMAEFDDTASISED